MEESCWSRGSVKESNEVVNMGGRSGRVCDGCARDRVRWYCAADQAYLCLRCDEAVHSANSVASRHLRIRLNPNCKLPPLPPNSNNSIATSDSPLPSSNDICQHRRVLHKRRRSSRPSRPSTAAAYMGAFQSSNDAVEKTESGQKWMDAAPMVFRKPKVEDDEAAHEVPVLLPLYDAFSPRSVGDCTLLVQASAVPRGRDDFALGFVVPDGFQTDALLDPGPPDTLDDQMLDIKPSREATAVVKVEEMAAMEDLHEVFSLCGGENFCGEDYCIDFCCIKGFRQEAEEASPERQCVEDEEENESNNERVDAYSVDHEVKIEEDGLEYGEAMTIEVDEMLASEWNGCKEEEVKQKKICLRLNYEDVLSAWSDRGPLWADGTCPQIVPDAYSCEAADDALSLAHDRSEYLDTGLVPDISSFYSESSTTGDQSGQVPVVNASEESSSMRGREARVMRYREKRRTRLFSKKIRYEVRKLNAERRPRLKGRFVKKNISC